MHHVLSENEIQNSILEWLYFVGIFAWRNNSAAVYDKRAGAYRRKSKHDKNGVSDILAILPDGRLLAIEVKKNKRQKPSQAQANFIDHINNQGGIAMVAWSIEQVEERLKEYIKV